MNKPEHLSKEIGDQFSDKSIVDNYHYRPQYSRSVIDALEKSVDLPSLKILDIGSGTGEVSIPLSQNGHTVIGVDPSAEMVRAANKKGSSANFVNSYIEDFSTDQKFDLFVAANSIHWPDWNVMFPLLKSISKEHSKLAIVTGGDLVLEEIQEQILDVVKTYSTTQNFKPYSIVDMLIEQKYISNLEINELPAEVVSQSVSEYVASFHARNGFSLERMPPEQAQAFDSEINSVLDRNGYGNEVTGNVRFKVTVADIGTP